MGILDVKVFWKNGQSPVDIRLKKPINIKCIIKYWDTIQRICISLKERKTTQATLVRKLAGYKNNHPLLEA
jgi:TnpA family transposase